MLSKPKHEHEEPPVKSHHEHAHEHEHAHAHAHEPEPAHKPAHKKGTSVWLLETGPPTCPHLVGIFSTKEKAEEAASARAALSVPGANPDHPVRELVLDVE